MFGKVILCIILLFFSAGPGIALLYLVYRFRVDEDTGAVYTSIGLGILLFLGSFSSTAITMLESIGIELVAWKAAHSWIKCSRLPSKANLPTPLQYGISLRAARSPGILVILSTIPYLFSRKRARLPPMMRLILYALFVQVILGLAVVVSDVWLHLASTTVPNSRIFPLPTVSTAYSRILPASCTTGQSEYVSENDISFNNPPCTVSMAENVTASIVDLPEGLSTLNNVSSTNAIHVDVNGTAIIVEAQPTDDLDFTAQTFGMRSTCTPISSACHLGLTRTEVSTPYDCGTLYPGVKGDLGAYPEGNVNLTVFNPQGGSTNIGTGLNPFHAAVAAVVVNIEFTTLDPEFVFPFGGNSAILLWCEMEFLDVAYSRVGGEISVVDSNRSSSITSFALSGPIASQASGIPELLWFSAETDAVSYDSKLFSTLFSKDLSRITMALNSGILINSSSTTESLRTTLLVSRIPKAPFLAFIVAALLYLLFNVILILIVLSLFIFQTKDKFRVPITARQLDIVKARLHDPLGVVQECFGARDHPPGIKAIEMFPEDKTDGRLRIAVSTDETRKIIVLES